VDAATSEANRDRNGDERTVSTRQVARHAETRCGGRNQGGVANVRKWHSPEERAGGEKVRLSEWNGRNWRASETTRLTQFGTRRRTYLGRNGQSVFQMKAT